MAKRNKYWGLVAVGALTAAAAGVIAAAVSKKPASGNRSPKDDFDDFDDLDNCCKGGSCKPGCCSEKAADGEEEKEDFVSWEEPEGAGDAEEADSADDADVAEAAAETPEETDKADTEEE